MKHFRSYRFPPLSQFIAAGQRASNEDTDGQWQASVSEGFEQGQRDGYEVGLVQGQQDGYDTGRSDGMVQGREEGRNETLVALDRLARPVDAILRDLKKVRADYREAQRKEVVDLVAKVARQVIRAELALQPVQLLALVDETLASMPPTREEIDVFLNPEELKRISELDPKRAKRWNLIADARLDAGECRIKAGDNEVDAGCHQRLSACMEQVSSHLALAAEHADQGRACMIADTLRSFEIGDIPVATPTGRLVGASGLLLESAGCRLHTGQRCQIETVSGEWLDAQVVGFREKLSYLMPFKKATGLTTGARVLPLPDKASLQIGPSWLGRMVNGLGEPIDDLGRLGGEHILEVTPPKINPLKKQPVIEPLDVGVRAINSMLTLGKGQRVGLMAGSGVGKSVLLGLITRQTVADVVVVGLIGERGREVREFVEKSLGAEGLKKAVLVIAPADESPLMRIMATELCHSIAAHYRDQGKHVLLLVDSLTRYAMALREVALALGEPPATRGYPPSVFSNLPQLVESAGNGAHQDGSMSAIYTVLAEGDDQQDPVVDTARAILDGHIVLTRELAERGHYPAIDIAASISRCMAQVITPEHMQAARALKASMARHARVRDLIPLGAYVPGADPITDRAVQLHAPIEAFLCQGTKEEAPMGPCIAQLEQIMA